MVIPRKADSGGNRRTTGYTIISTITSSISRIRIIIPFILSAGEEISQRQLLLRLSVLR